MTGRDVVVCHRCGRRGHIARNCEGILLQKGETDRTPSVNDVKSNAGAKKKVRLSNTSPVHNKKTPVVEAKINGHEFICVLDTGASISLISKEKWESCFSDQQPVPAELVAETAISTPMGILGKNYPFSPSRW